MLESQAAQESQPTIRQLFYFQYRVFSELLSVNLLDFNELKYFNSTALFFSLITFPQGSEQHFSMCLICYWSQQNFQWILDVKHVLNEMYWIRMHKTRCEQNQSPEALAKSTLSSPEDMGPPKCEWRFDNSYDTSTVHLCFWNTWIAERIPDFIGL